MNIEYVFLIIMVFSVILASGFLSFSESAVLSLNKNKFLIHQKEHPKSISTRALNKILKNKNNYISTIIILNTVVNIGGSIIIGGMTAQLFGVIPSFYIFGFEFNINILFTILFTFLILYFAEMIPKLVAAQNPLKLALFVSPVLVIFNFLIKPLVWISTKICRPFIKENNIETEVSLIEVKTIIKEANKYDIIKDRELDIIDNTLKLSEKTVKDIMKCKTQIEKVRFDKRILDFKEDILRFHHSRIIVSDENNKPIGVVIVRDILKGILQNEDKVFGDYLHSLLIVKENDTLSHVLSDLNNTLDHLAVVQCEDGSYLGVLAVEDILDSLSIGFKNI